MKKIAIISLLALWGAVSGAQVHDNPFAVKPDPAEPITYHNPVIPGFHSDPSICRAGEDYYLVTSTFEYFPGIPVYHSKDLVNWELIGHCIHRKEQFPQGMNIYACTIRYHEGTFYMITTDINGMGNFYMTASDPAGPWSDPMAIDLPGIDPDLFFDDDGKVYAMSSEFYLYEIDVKTGKRLTEGKKVWWGTGGRYAEGPHIYKKDGYYYLMAAEGGTEEAHCENIARSNTIWGPYTENPANPILAHANAAAQGNPIQGVGHADMVQAHDGSWWMVCHGYRKVVDYPVHHILGRETCLVPVNWAKYAWPTINGNGTVTIDMRTPTLPLEPFPTKSPRDEFEGTKLGLEWNFIRIPTDYYTISDGALRIKGQPQRIGERGSPAFIGRRIQSNDFTAETTMNFNPAKENEEAGFILLHESQHFDLRVKKSGDSRVLYVQLKFGSVVYKTEEVVLRPGPVKLRIQGARQRLNFAYAQGNDAFKQLESVEARYLSTETIGGFTGIYVGFYATVNGAECEEEAVFDYFEYSAD
ncbi:MAG: glycoside hydrolase family 43 protein [Lentisphaerae bacterium]|nr:glycoside hydrolase family 43 protein [Lentisphaerota bacterium]